MIDSFFHSSLALPGEKVISYNVIDSNGCRATTSDTVFVSDIKSSFAVSHDTSGNNTGAIDVAVSGEIPPYSLQWSNGNTASSLSNLAAGTYSLTVTDSISCVRVDSLKILTVYGISGAVTSETGFPILSKLFLVLNPKDSKVYRNDSEPFHDLEEVARLCVIPSESRVMIRFSASINLTSLWNIFLVELGKSPNISHLFSENMLYARLRRGKNRKFTNIYTRGTRHRKQNCFGYVFCNERLESFINGFCFFFITLKAH